MKTDVQNKSHASSEVKGKSSTTNDAMKVIRKTLHPLQEAAGDKENLVGAGRALRGSSSKEDPNKAMSKIAVVSLISKAEKKPSVKTEKKITVDDLTSEDGPSEHYWEILAERRRVALDKTLHENQALHEKIELLEAENRQYKTLLEESQALVEVLNEVLAETHGEEDEENNANNDIVIHRQ